MGGDRTGFVADNKTHSLTAASLAGVFLILAIALFGISGCGGSEKSNFYMLDPLVRLAPPSPMAENLDIDIVIGPVTLPEYLNRAQIVRRSGRYEIDIAEFDRWAETLESSIPRVLAENLSVLLSTENVSVYPSGRSAPDYQVRIDILQFDGDNYGNVELTVRWAVSGRGEEKRLRWQKFSGQKTIAGQGYSGMVSAMSFTLYDLSREIAQHIMTQTIEGAAQIH